LAFAHAVQHVVRGQPLVPGAGRAEAERAVALDDDVALGHAALGVIRLYVDWDWAGAGRELERALDLDPTDALVRHGYADYLSVMGRVEEGLEQVKLGRHYDPLSPLAIGPVVGHLLFARHYDEARREAQALLTQFPSVSLGPWTLAWAAWLQGRREEAVAQFRQNLAQNRELVEALDRGHAVGGPRGALRAVAAYEADPARSQDVGPLTVAEYYAQAGETDLAFDWLERAYRQREGFIVHVTFSPLYDPLRSDARFAGLMRRLGLPGQKP
jgi:tetratricopeptide (TPR) repeat protein